MTEQQPATPGHLGRIYFGCAVLASGVVSVFIGIVGALR